MSTNTTSVESTTSALATTSLTSSTTSTTSATSTTSTTSNTPTTSTTAAAVVTTTYTTSTAAGSTTAVVGGTTTTVPASSAAVVTSIVSESATPSTVLYTSVVTQSDGTTAQAVTVVVTSEVSATAAATTAGASTTTSAAASSTSSSASSLSNDGSSGSGSSGLSTGGKTAIAVVVPVVVVALLVLLGLYLWRRRKQKKAAEETRRKEVEEYGYNPNNDPTLPAIGSDAPSELTEDASGYRGWGATAMSGRKASTNMSGGHTQQLSDTGSNAGYSTSPVGGIGSETHSGDHLMNHDSAAISRDDLGDLGAAPIAGAGRYDGMKRGPSNASSSYSAGARSENSDSGVPYGQAISSESYQPDSNYSFTQPGPYGDGSYGGGDGMPIVRDVSARRNTQIERGGRYQQANSGIAQNF